MTSSQRNGNVFHLRNIGIMFGALRSHIKRKWNEIAGTLLIPIYKTFCVSDDFMISITSDMQSVQLLMKTIVDSLYSFLRLTCLWKLSNSIYIHKSQVHKINSSFVFHLLSDAITISQDVISKIMWFW